MHAHRNHSLYVVSLTLLLLVWSSSSLLHSYSPRRIVPRVLWVQGDRNPGPWGTSRRSNDNNDRVFDDLERQVRASAQSNRDFQKVIRSLDDVAAPAPVRNDLMYETEDLNKPPPSQIQVAAAASIITACLAFISMHSVVVTLVLSSFVFVAATMDDDLSGAVARILGRTTLKSVEATQPKIKAVARAVVTGEQEVAQLKDRIIQLEDEVRELRLWKSKRVKFENGMARYSLNDLRYMAKQRGLPDSGTKGDLLTRLVQANVIPFDQL